MAVNKKKKGGSDTETNVVDTVSTEITEEVEEVGIAPVVSLIPDTVTVTVVEGKEHTHKGVLHVGGVTMKLRKDQAERLEKKGTVHLG